MTLALENNCSTCVTTSSNDTESVSLKQLFMFPVWSLHYHTVRGGGGGGDGDNKGRKGRE